MNVFFHLLELVQLQVVNSEQELPRLHSPLPLPTDPLSLPQSVMILNVCVCVCVCMEAYEHDT